MFVVFYIQGARGRSGVRGHRALAAVEVASTDACAPALMKVPRASAWEIRLKLKPVRRSFVKVMIAKHGTIAVYFVPRVLYMYIFFPSPVRSTFECCRWCCRKRCERVSRKSTEASGLRRQLSLVLAVARVRWTLSYK